MSVIEPGDDGGARPVDDEAGVEFARRFLTAVVTAERAAEIVAGIVGPVVRFGPTQVGPNGIATATAEGVPGPVTGRCVEAHTLQVTVPVALQVCVRLGNKPLPVRADVVVRLRLRPRLLPTPAIAVDVDRLDDGDVEVSSHTRGVAGAFLRRMGNLDDELRGHVLAFVDDLLVGDLARAARHIDLVEIVDRAWDNGLLLDRVAGPGTSSAPRAE